MIKKFKVGDLVLYHREEKKEYLNVNAWCIIINYVHSDYDHYYEGIGVSYWNCLFNGKLETICDIWLKKTSLK